MKKWVLGLLLTLLALPALAAPRVSGNNGESKPADSYEVGIAFSQGDTTDSEAIYVRNTCFIRAVVAGSDVLQVWAISAPTTAASSGTQVGSDIGASTSAPISFQPGSYWVKVKSSTATTGGSTMKIGCGDLPLSATGGGVPGLVGDTGNDETLNYLQQLRTFQSVSEQLTTTVYVDPFYGSDSTGDGSYTAPYFSFAKTKTTCLTVPHSKCVVKGRNRWFTHTLLTLTYGAASTRHLMPGETVTFTTPTGAAEVLAVDGNLAAVTWLSGADPLVGGAATAFATAGNESVGTVTAVRDSLNGFPSRVLSEVDIDEATEIITSTGHGYTNGSGPFLWYNETTTPVTVPVLTEGSTEVYICSVSGATFRIGTSSACSTLYTFTDDGTGSNQIIAGLDGNGLRKSIDVSCRDNTRLCVLFKPEYADSPWGIDSGRLPGDGARYAEANSLRWSQGTVNSLPYNTPTGGLFIALASVADPLTHGWVGVENGVIQNLADDCFYAGNGGKIIALGVRCNIVNGTGDRGQNGTVAPRAMSHSSVLSVSGVSSVNANAAGAVGILIGADGSTSQQGSDNGSGGFLNPNNHGALRFISSGTMKYDGIAGATDCNLTFLGIPTTPCNSPFMVQPGGDALVVGPHVIMGGNSLYNQLVETNGSDSRIVFAKLVADSRGVLTAVSSNNDPAFFNVAGGADGHTKTIRAHNVTFRSTGPHLALQLCPLLGTPTADRAGATSRLDMLVENSVWEWITAAAASYRISVSSCGGYGAGYTAADAMARASVKFRGVWDFNDDNAGCAGGPCYFDGGSSVAIGSCGTSGFLNTVCTAVDGASQTASPTAWEWFTVKSADSGGVGADGLQWATTDPQLRCANSTKECYGDTNVNSPTYTLALRDYWLSTDVSCIPKDVLGKQVCAFNLKSVHAGAR